MRKPEDLNVWQPWKGSGPQNASGAFPRLTPDAESHAGIMSDIAENPGNAETLGQLIREMTVTLLESEDETVKRPWENLCPAQEQSHNVVVLVFLYNNKSMC